MSPSLDLTDEQQAVVQHDEGPAVVRAVPGAGKTTAMAYRIRYLVHEEGVASGRILATSFSRETVRDLEGKLSALDVHGVDTRTLHALGLSLLRTANTGDVLPPDAPDPGAADHILARRALTGLAAERDLDTAELGISAQELADQVAAWKQQLAYPDPDAADLSPTAREQAHTATHENEDFLTLYRRFERHRRREGWLTYADMLREGWALLVGNEALRNGARTAYSHVLVDEFQDVSRVQFLLLDVLTAEPGDPAQHGNYMVIGDADQCIYGWRGADPSFLVDFDERYDATTYEITDSFRLPAAPLVLANAVIEENETRGPKQLHLTQGFNGSGQLVAVDGSQAIACRLANEIVALQDEGYALDDIAVLVRTYGQTPPLERAFLDRNLPYRIRGNRPFYRRREVQTLLHYLYWAVLERRLRQNGWLTDTKAAERYSDRFARILKTPNRYVEHGRIDRIVQEAKRRQTSALDVLAEHAPDMHDRTTERMERFLEVAEELVGRLDAPPGETLDWLIDAVDYEAALRERSAFAERGDARVRTARALVRYADAYDSTPALLHGIQSLVAERKERPDAAPALDVRSIHRAKGAEWPVVIVPGCTEGILPLDADGDRELEEERRLFYVAVTRPSERLHLATDTSDERSRFLDEAEVESRLDTVRQIRSALNSAPESLSDAEVAVLCRGIVELGVERYFRRWWSPPPKQRASLRTRLNALRPAITDARKRRNAYRQAQAEHKSAKKRAESSARERVEVLRANLGDAPLTATNEQSDIYFPEDARFTFCWTDDESRIAVLWDDTQAGTLDPFGAHRLDAQVMVDLPWEAMIGRFETVTQGRDTLHFTIDWAATASTLASRQRDALSPPNPPSQKTQLLTSNAFERGYEALRSILSVPEPASQSTTS